ncbi:MAG: tRNA dihydrouridine synthase DusB [Candidatus Pelethousia sp.]|nr:tRNA dihydrouridine synthase DusB [Candidatus Pelethousia sp.]
MLSFLPTFPILLAPMAGVTDLSYRALCKELGCDFTYTEMVSAKGLYYGGPGSASLLETAPVERPCGVQLFGRDPALMAEIVRRLCGENTGELALIDINMGCPAPKITGNGEGSALMLEPALAGRIIAAVVQASDLPVTVKFRKGFDAAHINALAFARMAEENGAAMVAIHGRTRAQMYSGKADWDCIAEVKTALSIPVIGNGDVFTGADALAMRAHTGCDGIMVARGAQGNPFIFREIKAALKGEPYAPPTERERLDMAMEHLRRAVAHKGPRAVIEMRKHVAWYLKGVRGAAALRAKVNAACTPEEMFAILKQGDKEDYPAQ